MVLALCGVIRCMRLHEKTWHDWSQDAFRGWIEYLKLGIPGLVMVCMEYVSFLMCADDNCVFKVLVV